MAEPKQPDDVMLIIAVISGKPAVTHWARNNLQNRYGPIGLESDPFDFTETRYYDEEMGGGLRKQFFAFERLIQPDQLVEIKRTTNELELIAAANVTPADPAVRRPLNLDPGYLHSGKWVLATTKDQSHRVYLGRGIYGEATLRYERGEFVAWPWTYPNYRRDDYRAFFKAARTEYLRLLRKRLETPQ